MIRTTRYGTIEFDHSLIMGSQAENMVEDAYWKNGVDYYLIHVNNIAWFWQPATNLGDFEL